MSYEWVTTLVIKHEAGSEEGAVYQRSEWLRAIEATGAVVTMAGTNPGDATDAGLRAFFASTEDDE